MNIYTVFVPAGLTPIDALERMRFVKQGFDWEAFLITPLWAARQKLWLALSLWIAALAAISLTAIFGQFSGGVTVLIYTLVSLAFGLESDRFRQARLARAGFLLYGLALGASVGEAELVYLGADRNRFSGAASPAAQRNARNRWPSSLPADESDLLGLFPSGEWKP